MTLINVGAFTGNALSPQLLDLVDGSYPNLFLAGAAFQALVLLVLLQFNDGELSVVAAEDTVTESTGNA